MRNIIKTLTNTMTWAASSDITAIDLPREGLITQIDFNFAITMSAGLTAVQPDGLFRICQNLKVEGEGGRSYLGLSGEQTSRLLAYLNMYDYGMSAITLQDGTTEYITLRFHPGNNPKDPFDTSIVIPAQDLSTLQAKWTTTANTVVDDTTTISSGTGYITVYEVLDEPTPAGVMTPLSSTYTWAHDANYSDYSKEIDVQTGAYLRRMLMLVQDETATRPIRKDDEVVAVAVKLPKVGTRLIEMRWEALKAHAARSNHVTGSNFQEADEVTGHMSIPDGVAVIDFRQFATNPMAAMYGLDLRNAQAGDVKLGLTVENYTSGDDTLIFYDMVKVGK